MTYNTDRRSSMSKAKRLEFLIAHGRRCYWCREPITDDLWDVEHLIAKELMPPGSDWDAPENKAPIHRHPRECHKQKTMRDIKLIAKSNRIRRANGPVELRKKKRPIPQRKASWPKRSFPKRLK